MSAKHDSKIILCSRKGVSSSFRVSVKKDIHEGSFQCCLDDDNNDNKKTPVLYAQVDWLPRVNDKF